MIIDPREALNIIKPVLPDQIQQAGIDLTLDTIYRFKGSGVLDFDNSKRKIAETEIIEFKEYVDLNPGPYKIRFTEYFEIPNDTIGILFPRSTLLRNGCTINSGLFDPGFKGYGEVLLIAFNPIRLYKKARIAQIVLFKNDKSFQEYSGIYKKQNL